MKTGTGIVLVAALAVSSASAMQKNAPRYADVQELPAIGLVLPVMPAAKQVPPAAVEVKQYRCRLGDKEWTENRYDACELWRKEQTAASWIDRYGNGVTLAKVLMKRPTGLQEADVTQDVYEKIAADDAFAIGENADGAVLVNWIEDFAGVRSSGKPVAMQVNPMRLSHVIEIPLQDPKLRAYVFRLNPHAHDASSHPRHWFALILNSAEAPRQGDRDWDNRIKNELLASIRTSGLYERAKADQRASKRKVRASGAPAKLVDDAERARARKSVELLDDWWFMDSENYIMLSDDSSSDRVADAILGNLEALRPRYAALVPPFPNTIEGTSIVRLFKTSDEYISYLTADGDMSEKEAGNTAGIFISSRRELVIRPFIKNSTQDVGAVIRHEGFHQYLFAAWGGALTPPWFNEGSAEFFKSYERNGQTWVIREDKISADYLQRMARENDDWSGIVRRTMFESYAQFYSHAHVSYDKGNSRRTLHPSYALSYGIMYFLYRGAPAMRGDPYKDVLPTFYRAMEETRDPNAATRAAFKMDKTDDFFARFVRDLHEFWKSDNARGAARTARVP